MKTKIIPRKIETEKADQFKDKDGYYIFPFEVLDKTPGGQNLGRIMFEFEFIRGPKRKGRYYVEKILLQVRQTRDEKYRGKVFEIPCFTEAVLGDTLDQEGVINHVWKVAFCEVHKELYFSAYPKDKHTALKICVGSSIGVDMDFI